MQLLGTLYRSFLHAWFMVVVGLHIRLPATRVIHLSCYYMKKRISVRIDEDCDLILSELASLCRTDKSTVVRMMLNLQVERVIDQSGNITEAFKNEIKETLQCSCNGRDSP